MKKKENKNLEIKVEKQNEELTKENNKALEETINENENTNKQVDKKEEKQEIIKGSEKVEKNSENYEKLNFKKSKKQKDKNEKVEEPKKELENNNQEEPKKELKNNNQEELKKELKNNNQEETKTELKYNNQEELKTEKFKNNNQDEQNNENKEFKPVTEKEKPTYKKKKSKKGLVIAIVITLLIFVALAFSVIFSLLNMNNQNIIDGVSILGIDVSGLSVEQAKNQINDAIENRFQDENNNLILKRDEEETNVTANTFNAKFDVDKAVAEAYNIGRKGNIIIDNYEILFTKLSKRNVDAKLYLDETLLNAAVEDVSSKMKDVVKESSYYIEDDNLIIVKGKAGYIVDAEALKNKIYSQLSNIHTNYQVIEIPTIYKEPDPINLEKIRDEIYKEPQDAYVEKNPTKVHPHVDGIDFGISIEEAEKLLETDQEEYTIPLKITAPKKTINDLGEEAFPDLLATFSTTYDASNKNRSTNIELASSKVNGTVIMPGENFSYNTVVGRRTIEAGYKEGTAYIGGKVVPDVGGGICQLSSTIYNVALFANLEIVERSNHMFLTGYVAAGRDATVYYGSIDFVFKNTREYPIKIVTDSKNGVCKVSIYGIKEEKEYQVVLQPKITSYIPYTTTYEDDPTLEEGKEVVEQAGVNGCRSECYKILKLDGKVVEQKLLSKDTYKAKEKIVRRGTKKVVAKPTQKPEETPNETPNETPVEKPDETPNEGQEQEPQNNNQNTAT